MVDADKRDDTDPHKRGQSIDIGLSLNEIPTGSAWPAMIACLTTALLMALLLFAKHLDNGSLGGTTVPALLVAFVSNSITLVSSLFVRAGVVASAMSRLVLLGCAACGNTFAVWWIFNQSDDHLHNVFIRFIDIYAGYALLAATTLLLAIILFRLVQVIRIYDRTVHRFGRS